MEMQIIAIYAICDELNKQSGFNDNKQARMTMAEVMACAIIAAYHFCGNQKIACLYLKDLGYFKTMLGPSRFNRRLHAIPHELWHRLFHSLSEIHQQNNPELEFAVNSFPVAACQNMRIKRSKIYKGKTFYWLHCQ